MASCVVFCAAEFSGLVQPITKEDYIIAADGGVRHTCALGITPNAILGDFDSLEFVPENAQVFPVEKDDTDAMLAVRHGLKRGFRHFLLYGGLDGPRIDHTLANFQLLQFLADHGARGYLIGKDSIATVLKNGAVHFAPGAQGLISVFCIGQAACGVTLTGLQYPLENAVLTAGHPLGVSNHFMKRGACVQVTDGSLLLIYDRTNGLCEEG